MNAWKRDDLRDFATRQYASLIGAGVGEREALQRLHDVLGADAVAFLASDAGGAGHAESGDAGVLATVVGAASCMGGNTANARAAIVASLSDARLLALDWWRPIRTFLLYLLFLFGLAAMVSLIYLLFVLPAFTSLDQTMGVNGGAAGWIAAHGAIRLLLPLVLMAVVFAVLAVYWWRMRQRMDGLEPLAGRARPGRAGNRSVQVFEALRCLEFAAAIRASGVADALVLEPALRAAGWPAGEDLRAGEDPLGEKLRQAERLGTFGEELDWQRRLHWSITQARLELSRDRLILFARVLFYILVGSMITVLYLPIFSVASMIGVQ